MSEAWGTILIKAPEGALPILGEDDEEYSWADMVKLAGYAGIESLIDSHPLLKVGCQNGCIFSIEEVPIRKFGFTVIEIFGEEWMWVLSGLVNAAQNIEIYGSIFHEHNVTELYALNPDGQRFCKQIDGEGATSSEQALAIKAEWLTLIPGDVRQKFSSELEFEDEDE